MEITVHGELNMFHENNFAKSRFTATKEITIHEEKISHFTFHGKKGRLRVTKIPFTTFIRPIVLKSLLGYLRATNPASSFGYQRKLLACTGWLLRLARSISLYYVPL